jgi:D-glycero-D-manno-heptose 1,7-bisphosphate phosphatase
MARSRKKTRPIVHRLEFAAVYAVTALFRLLPEAMARALAKGLSWIFFMMVPKRRSITLRNLQQAFGRELTPDEIMECAKASYRNLALSAVELARYDGMSRDQIQSIIRVEGGDHFEKARAKGRGVVVFGAHMGNWELPNLIHSLLYPGPYVVARALDNPFLDRLVVRFRGRFGSRIINTRQVGALQEIVRVLMGGGSVGFLMDQNVVGDRGVFVDFFGKLAYTHKVVAMVAQRTGATAISMFGFREPNGHHRMVYGPPIEMVSTGNRYRDTVQNTQRMTRTIEKKIREQPAQWFWMHDRWKKRPKAGMIGVEDSAVFLDRDGTITEEVGYVRDLSNFGLIKGSAEAIRLLNRRGIRTVVVTNQSGVARGYFPEAQVRKVNLRLEELLTREGSRLDAIYYCPHHPTEGQGDYTYACDCRKPEPGMLYQAEADHGVRLSQSFVVGDKLSDVELAHRVGAQGVLVRTGYGEEELRKIRSGLSEPDFVAEDLLSAVRWIVQRLERPGP